MAYQMILEDAGMEGVPIVLVSSVIGLGAVASRIGTPYFLSKPFDLGKLLGTMRRAAREGGAARHTNRAT
jgi:hypothetical protein